MDSDRTNLVSQKRIAIVLILLGAILMILNITLMSKIEWGVIVIGILCICLGLFGGIETSPKKHE